MGSITKLFKSSTAALNSRFAYCLIAVNLLAIIAGFSTFLPLGYIQKYFSNHCVLYADLRLKLEPVMNETTVKVCLQTSIWAPASTCDFTTFAPVVATIHAFIWCWFFLLMKKALKEEKCDYQLLLPAALCHGIMFIVLLVCGCIISVGWETFCRNLYKELNSQFTCSEIFDLNWDIYSTGKKKRNIFGFLETATISVWIMTAMTLVQSLLTGYKLYYWFLQHLHVHHAMTQSNLVACG